MYSNWKGLIEASTNDIRRLSAVWRFSSIPVVAYETTAEHSFYVAIYAAMIHLEANSDDERKLGAVIMNALMHDVPEAVTGDVVRPFKYSSEKLRANINEAEHDLVEKMPQRIHDLFVAAEDMTLEGKAAEDMTLEGKETDM